MSIPKFIEKICVQTAVYWGSPVDDGYGTKTFAEPIEIKCRWEDIVEVVSDRTGKDITSKAKVLVPQDLDEEGYLFLGTLDSLYDSAESSGITLNPFEILGAYEIKRFDKIPLLKSTDKFVRTAYL